MQIQNVGQSDGSYTTVPRILGDDIICLEAHVPSMEQTESKVYVPDSQFKNQKMFFYKVVKQGRNVESMTSIREGDYIYVDMLARFSDTFPISFIDCRNALYKTDANGKSMTALKERIIVEVVEPTEKTNEFGFIQLTDIEPYGIVRSIGDGCKDRGFSIGDRLSIQKSEDSIQYVISGVKFFDYDYRTPSVKFKD